MYKEYKEPVCKLPSHRILAINRGEKQECLKVKLEIDNERVLADIEKKFITADSI